MVHPRRGLVVVTGVRWRRGQRNAAAPARPVHRGTSAIGMPVRAIDLLDMSDESSRSRRDEGPDGPAKVSTASRIAHALEQLAMVSTVVDDLLADANADPSGGVSYELGEANQAIHHALLALGACAGSVAVAAQGTV